MNDVFRSVKLGHVFESFQGLQKRYASRNIQVYHLSNQMVLK